MENVDSISGPFRSLLIVLLAVASYVVATPPARAQVSNQGYIIVATLPAKCFVGQTAFLTTAIAGSNWYGCTSANTWTLESGGGGGGGGTAVPPVSYSVTITQGTAGICVPNLAGGCSGFTGTILGPHGQGALAVPVALISSTGGVFNAPPCSIGTGNGYSAGDIVCSTQGAATFTGVLEIGSGGGTSNASGTQYQIPYYATTGTQLSPNPAATLTNVGLFSLAAPAGFTGLMGVVGNNSYPALPSNWTGFEGPNNPAYTSYAFQFNPTGPTAFGPMIVGPVGQVVTGGSYASGASACTNGSQVVTYSGSWGQVTNATGTITVSGGVPVGPISLVTQGSGYNTTPTTVNIATCTGNPVTIMNAAISQVSAIVNGSQTGSGTIFVTNNSPVFGVDATIQGKIFFASTGAGGETSISAGAGSDMVISAAPTANIDFYSGPSRYLGSFINFSGSTNELLIGQLGSPGLYGILGVINGAMGGATTFWGSAATTNNTINGPAIVLPNGTLPLCSTSSTTCTIAPSALIDNGTDVLSSEPLGNYNSSGTILNTIVDGLQLFNTVASTSTNTIQRPPMFHEQGHVWNTTTPADNCVDFGIYGLPNTGAAPTGTFEFVYSLNAACSATPTFSSAGSLTSAGKWTSAALTITGTGVVLSGLGAESSTQSTLCITTSGTTVQSNAAATCTVSNESVKHDIFPLTAGTPELMALNPISFKYNDGDQARIWWGFGAKALAGVNRSLASGWRADGQPWSIDDPAIEALTVKTVQEQQRRIEALEARITALEAK